ncbi:MAG: phosphatidylinositol mannoside acyltransferase [Candidatus Nanopelagicales bacterium]
MRDEVSDRAYAAGWALVKRMPERMARATFNGLAEQVWRRRGTGVQQLERNLRRVVGPHTSHQDLRRLSHRAVESYFRYWREAFRLPNLSPQQIVSTIEVDGQEHMRAAIAAGRGLLIVLPHSGNWDHAGAWATIDYMPLTTVAERLKPESLYERFLDYRRSLGMEVLALGDRMVLPTLRRRLNDGGMVCLLADRDLSASGIQVEFFGEPTKMPAGPALLAYETGADLMPASLWYEPDRSRVRIHPPVLLDRAAPRAGVVREATQVVADAFAKGIAEHPEDWHMLQRLWLTDLPPRPAP